MKKIVCFALCVSAAMMVASCVEEKDGQVSAAGELVEITLGVAGETSVKGYGGDIKTLVGMNSDGTVRTVIVLENKETPGLGSNVCVRKEQKTLKTLFSKSKKTSALAPNRILDYYSGKSVNSNTAPWQVSKDGGTCPYITGATVSSRALCKVVYHIVSVYSSNRQALQAEFLKTEGK